MLFSQKNKHFGISFLHGFLLILLMTVLEVIEKLTAGRDWQQNGYFNNCKYLPLSEKQYLWLIQTACKENKKYDGSYDCSFTGRNGEVYTFGPSKVRRYVPRYIKGSRKVNCIILNEK